MSPLLSAAGYLDSCVFFPQVVWVTCTLPGILIIILLITATTLDGFGKGIEAYIGTWYTPYCLRTHRAGFVCFGFMLA